MQTLLALVVLAATEGASKADLSRARQKVPAAALRGEDFTSMNGRLTRRLQESLGRHLRSCEAWSTDELRQLQRRLLSEAEPELLAVYESSADPRHRRFASLTSLEAHWARLDSEAEASHAVRRDGLCHEAVMWWVHHLSEATRQRLAAQGLEPPSLPELLHSSTADAALDEYRSQVSCQQCHTGPVSFPSLENATLALPLPVDQDHPGLERLHTCDYQYQPPCGPCEGLGGRRWGDGVREFEPMECAVLHGPEGLPTTEGRYPALATARITGETRSPIEVIPTNPATYHRQESMLYMGYDDKVMRMRYDAIGGGSQISAQSFEQADRMDVGATINLNADTCVCMPSIAGNWHLQSFESSDPMDAVQLPPNEGGAAYLGRVRVVLDGNHPETNGTAAIADHYMKWEFHFLVDADESSPSFGLPLRLYGPTGTRQVFDSWQLGDPAIARPDVWDLPSGCSRLTTACQVFDDSSNATELVVSEQTVIA